MLTILHTLSNLFTRNSDTDAKQEESKIQGKPIGATLDWSLNVVCEFKDGWILPYQADRLLNAEYYTRGDDWPRDPETGLELPIIER